MEVVDTRATASQLEASRATMLDVARFSNREDYRDMQAAPYDENQSVELLMVVT